MAPSVRRYGYGEVRDLIQKSLGDCPGFGSRVEVDGKISRIDQGIWHDNYWFWIKGRDVPADRKEQAYVLRLLDQRDDWQQGPKPRERLLREATTLQALKRTRFAHPTPQFVCFVKDDGSEAKGMIETALPGYSQDRYKDRSTLKLVARVAANIHRLDQDDFNHLPRSNSRKEQVTSQLGELDEAVLAEFPLASEVRAWISAQTPSDDRPCLIHGDLLPQNLLCDLPSADQEEPPVAVVDWEMARIGDPAYELAIVSRGDRRVLGVRNGLKALVEDYLEYGGKPLSLRDVRAQELLLVLHWLEEAWREYQKPQPRGHGPDHYEAKLRSLFRRTVD